MITPKTVFDSIPRIEMYWRGNVVAFDLSQSEHQLGREPQQPPPIGLVVPISWELVSRHQATLKKVGTEYHIYDGDGSNPSSNRLFINNRLITPQEGYRLQTYDELRIGQDPQNYATIVYLDPDRVRAGTTPVKTGMSLVPQQSVTIGRSEDNDFVLDAPTVSRYHAALQRMASGRYLLHNYSPNGVFVDRQKVDRTAPMVMGSVLQIGPYTFVLQNDALTIADRGDNIRLDVDRITKVVKRRDRQRLCLLDNITLAIEPGQFVAIVGGSGTGKSTLIKTLLGIDQPTHGQVYLNGDNLVNNFNIYRNTIGYVPQSDRVHSQLTVREVLADAARLRLPPDTDIQSTIAKTLAQIELLPCQDTLVKHLSSGQLKLVSIGVELLADPRLFCLDEPTAGLDPGLDKKMMQLLQRLSTTGRTVIIVTQNTSNIMLCDRLAFMGLDGQLCYFGPPAEATEFFEVPSLDFADIYLQLETPSACLAAAHRFVASSYYRTYIRARLSLPNIAHGNRSSLSQSPTRVKQSFFQQLQILTSRHLRLLQRNPVDLAILLLTAPIGIVLVYLAMIDLLPDLSQSFHQTANPLLNPVVGGANVNRAGIALKILLALTAIDIWVGLASALPEIIKEAASYVRERLVNLSLFTYVGSKLVVLAGLAAIQTCLISAIVSICFVHPAAIAQLVPIDWFVGLPITTFLSILAANCLGLMVSASFKNSSQANSALPLLLLPQIIFAGALFGLDRTAIGQFISWLTIGRWSIGAYGTLIDLNLLTSTNNTSYDPTWQNLSLNWGMLLLHSVVYLGATIWLQKRKDLLKALKPIPISRQG